MTYRNDPAWIAARADYTAEHPGEDRAPHWCAAMPPRTACSP